MKVNGTAVNCDQNNSGLDLTGSWKVSELKKGETIITLHQNGHGQITTEDKVVAVINSIEPAYRGVKVTFNMCEVERDRYLYKVGSSYRQHSHVQRKRSV